MRTLSTQALSLVRGLQDAIAPPRCIDCLCEGTWYCNKCRRNAPPHIQQCIGCKMERLRGRTCKDCAEDISLTGCISARTYSTQSVQRGIEWLKFKGIRSLADILAGILIPKLSLIAPFDELSKNALLVPVPLHKSRSLQRGFNQSEDIAHAIAQICSLEMRPLLVRTTATASQARLPHDLRAQNMESAFALAVSEKEYIELTKAKPIIILVDDVSTTGATFISAATALPSLDIVQVWGAAIARG